MVASYAFQSLNPQDKAQCKVQKQANQQIAHEQAVCLKNPAYQPNQPRMFPYKDNNKNNNLQQIDPECVVKIKAAVRTAVYDIVNTALTPYFWFPAAKRHQVANTVADDAAAKAEEFMNKLPPGMMNPAIVELLMRSIINAFCKTMELIPEIGFVISLGCENVFGPLLELALVIAICNDSGCCEPHTTSFDPTELAQQLAFVTAEESESDPRNAPFIPSSKTPMPCLTRLENALSKEFSKLAYFFLISNRDMPEAERMRVAKEVNRAVRDSVQRAMGPNGDGRLISNIVEGVSAVFPDIREKKFLLETIRKVVPLTIHQLNKEGCNFPVPY